MATKLNYWDWNQFTGLADTNVVGSKGQYDNESYNIDTQTEPNGVKLTPGLEIEVSTTDTPNVILNISDYAKAGTSGIYTFTDDGKIYLYGSLIYTHSSGKSITSATARYESGTLYIYFFTSGKMHRMQKSNSSVTEDYKTFESSFTPVKSINVYNDIYFTSGNLFKKMDYVANQVTTVYEFPEQDSIMGVTFFQDNFNIYTSAGGQGRQYLFPVLATEPYYNIEWEGLPILGVTNLGSTDYVITGFNTNYSDLYIVSGTQRKLLKANNEGTGRGFNGVIGSRLDDVYLGGHFNPLTGSTKQLLFKYGNYYPGFSNELTPFIGNITGDEEIKCITFGDAVVYIGTSGNKVYTIDLDQAPLSYQATGEIISMMMDFGMPDDKKSLQGFEISYSNKNTSISNRGGTLTLYARKSEADSWVEMKTTGNKTDIGNIRVDATEVMSKSFGDFYQIQFRVVLEGGATTPFLKKVRVLYQNNLQA